MTFEPSRTSTREYAASLPATLRSRVCSSGSSFGRSFRFGGVCGTACSSGFLTVSKP